jgi:chaperonin GroES
MECRYGGVISSLIFIILGMAEEVKNVGITPLHDRVVVRPLTAEELGTTSPSGIIIPDTVSKEKPEQGVVVAVGQGKWNEDGDARIPLTVTVGNKVVFSKYGYDEIKVDGNEYYIVSESSILGIITAKDSVK